MPIVGSDDGVRVEYSIPENIKEMITDDFLREFRNSNFVSKFSFWISIFCAFCLNFLLDLNISFAAIFGEESIVIWIILPL